MDVLWEAWKQVKENRGAPGVDGETIEGIVSRGEEGLMLSRLQDQLRAKTFRFQPVRRVDIPKPKGGTRPLGIATVEDRVVQTAMKLVLEPIFEADFHDCHLGPAGPRNRMKIAQSRAIIHNGWSGQIERAVENPRPYDCLIRSVRDRANKWCIVSPPCGSGDSPRPCLMKGWARSPLPPGGDLCRIG
jgi:hypothetical protein